jgi:hypothetical protein
VKSLIATVVTGGTPVPLAPVKTYAWWARIEKVAGSGNMYLGTTGLNRSTLANCGKVFSNTNPPDFVEITCIPILEPTGPFDLHDFFLDADTNNRSVVVLYA